MAVRIHAGLFPPTPTSVGTVMPAHSRGSGLPFSLSRTMVMSYGSVWATAVSLDHAGSNRMRATTKPGAPTSFMKSFTASPRRPSAISVFKRGTKSSSIGG